MLVKIFKGSTVKLRCCVDMCVPCWFCLAVGQSGRLQRSLSDFQPDYFSLTEKPPEEFCLSPNASTSSSSSGSSKSHISVDLSQKRGEAHWEFNKFSQIWGQLELWQQVAGKSRLFLFKL